MAEKRIARVFPTMTSMSPRAKDAYFGPPDLFTPDYDEVHISACFTWDIEKAIWLAAQWRDYGVVKIGGPAITDCTPGEFTPGMYVRPGVTITSRGCPGNCSYCLVPEREGPLRELEIKPGNIVQDNNLLACSRGHIEKVFSMLMDHKSISFAGGFDAKLVTDWVMQRLTLLSVKNIWLAFDREEDAGEVYDAVFLLRKAFTRNQVRCYVLIGQPGDDIVAAERRLKGVWTVGALPFAMRFRNNSANWADSFAQKGPEWSSLARNWTRPAIMVARMGK